jgi:hypothetical protein
MVRIIERRVELVNLPQELRRAASKFLDADTEQGLPWRHLDSAYGIFQ